MPFPTAETRTNTQLQWWRGNQDNPGATGDGLVAYAKALEDQSSTKNREERFRRYARMFGNAEILGLRPWEYQHRQSETRVTRNVIASCVETAKAMIAANRPAPKFLTNGADFKLRRKAMKLNKFGKGLLHASGFYDVAPRMFRDGGVFGTGFIKILTEGRSIRAERVFPWDILVEDADGMNMEPRTLVQRMYVSKDVAKAMWPEFAEQIEKARPIERGPGDSGASDIIVMYEGWHLPSIEKGKDGRHVIAIDGWALLDEAWDRPEHPFVVFRWEDPIAGFWGRGIAEQLQGQQIEINRLLIKVQESFHMGGMYKVILNASSGVPKAHVNNQIGVVYVVNNGTQAPTIVAPQTVHPEIFMQIDKLETKCFDEIGISQMAARSEKPTGLDSRVAIREYNDIKSDRFVMVGKEWERCHLLAVKLGLAEARKIKGFTVDVPDKNQKVEIRWTDVDLDRDAYILQCFPTSVLPQTPAGRIQGIQDLVELGALPQDSILEMLDAPDLEEITDLATSSRRAVRARVEAMLDEPDMEKAWQAPDPRINLAQAIQYVNAVYLEEQEKGCPEERLDLLRDYVDECIELLKKTMPQPTPTPPPGGPQPVAAAPIPMAA